MLSDLKQVLLRRELLFILVRRDLKVRYKNSRLGFFWSIAPPILQVIVITFALKHATSFASGFRNYAAYVLAALIPWTYFQTAVLDSSQSILQMYNVVKKVALPREIIPLATVLSNSIHFGLSWIVFALYLWGYLHAPILAVTVWMPYLMLVQLMLVTAVCLMVSCLNVFYEDVKYIVSTFMGLGLFALPIMFVVEQPYYKGSSWLHGWVFELYRHNPLAELLTGYRSALLQPPPSAAIGGTPFGLDYQGLLLAGAISFALLVCSYAYFNSRKWQFVERP